MYEILVGCCKSILHDLLASGAEAMAIQLEPPSLSMINNEVGFQSLSTLAAEAPHILSAALDIGKLHTIVSAALSGNEDQLCTLREDPGYYAEKVSDLTDHGKEHITDAHCNKHADLHQVEYISYGVALKAL